MEETEKNIKEQRDFEERGREREREKERERETLKNKPTSMKGVGDGGGGVSHRQATAPRLCAYVRALVSSSSSQWKIFK